MGKNVLVKVVQRGILLRDADGENEDEGEDKDEDAVEGCEALLLENPNGTWELPGGKIDEKESAFGSLQREVEEETGLTVTAAEPVSARVRKHKKKKPRGKFGVVYRCAFEGERVKLSDEHVGFAWMRREQVTEANLALVDEYRALLQAMDDVETDGARPRDGWRPAATNGERGDR